MFFVLRIFRKEKKNFGTEVFSFQQSKMENSAIRKIFENIFLFSDICIKKERLFHKALINFFADPLPHSRPSNKNIKAHDKIIEKNKTFYRFRVHMPFDMAINLDFYKFWFFLFLIYSRFANKENCWSHILNDIQMEFNE